MCMHDFTSSIVTCLQITDEDEIKEHIREANTRIELGKLNY